MRKVTLRMISFIALSGHEAASEYQVLKYRLTHQMI